MRKLNVKLLTLALQMLMTSSALAQAQQPSAETQLDDQVDVKAITSISALGVAGIAGASSYSNMTQMFETYQRNSVTVLAASDSTTGKLLSTSDIDSITSRVRKGDEVRVTYRLSQAEERNLRIEDATKRRNSLQAEVDRAKGKLRGAQAQANGQKIVDLTDVISDLDHEIADLRAGRIPMTHSIAVRVIDMDTVNLNQLQEFLVNKTLQRRHVVQVERVSRLGRMQMAKLRGLSRGQLLVAVLGGLVFLEEVTLGLVAGGAEELAGSTLFVPTLKEM